jgi:hypothetical protein
MKIYYNDRLIGEVEQDMHAAQLFMSKYLEDHNICTKPCYWRWVGLDNNKTMIDFGSWSKFFYVDCSCELLFKNDKTRNLPTDKE